MGAEAAEDRLRAPAADEGDGVGGLAGAQQCCGAARAEAAGGDPLGRDAREALDGLRSMVVAMAEVTVLCLLRPFLPV